MWNWLWSAPRCCFSWLDWPMLASGSVLEQELEQWLVGVKWPGLASASVELRGPEWGTPWISSRFSRYRVWPRKWGSRSWSWLPVRWKPSADPGSACGPACPIELWCQIPHYILSWAFGLLSVWLTCSHSRISPWVLQPSPQLICWDHVIHHPNVASEANCGCVPGLNVQGHDCILGRTDLVGVDGPCWIYRPGIFWQFKTFLCSFCDLEPTGRLYCFRVGQIQCA